MHKPRFGSPFSSLKTKAGHTSPYRTHAAPEHAMLSLRPGENFEYRIMKLLRLYGSYHDKPVDVYIYTTARPTTTVTVICKGLFGVFDPEHACAVNVLGNLLIEHGVSHVVFYNSSRDVTVSTESTFEDRARAFSKKTFNDELADLRKVVTYVIEHATELFGCDPEDVTLYLHGTSVGGTLALMLSTEYPQLKKLSLCAPPSSKGNSRKPIVSTMPEQDTLLSVAQQFTGDLFLLYGEEDAVVPRESSFKILEHATHAHTSFRVIPGANHDFRTLYGVASPEAHRVFAEAIFDFLRGRVTV